MEWDLERSEKQMWDVLGCVCVQPACSVPAAWCWWQLGDVFLELRELGADSSPAAVGCCKVCADTGARMLQSLAQGAALETCCAREPGLFSVLWGVGKARKHRLWVWLRAEIAE